MTLIDSRENVLVYNGLSQAIKLWTWIRTHPSIIKHRVHPYLYLHIERLRHRHHHPPVRPPSGLVKYFCACDSELFFILFMLNGNPYPLSRTWNLPSTTWNILYLPLYVYHFYTIIILIFFPIKYLFYISVSICKGLSSYINWSKCNCNSI